MLWIITVDHISTSICQTLGEPIVTHADRKMRADKIWLAHYRAAAPEAKVAMLEAFKRDMTDEFRLYDDDGELYYEGLCLNLDDQDGDSAFQPLDWAANDAGCTRMDYRKKGDTEWRTL